MLFVFLVLTWQLLAQESPGAQPVTFGGQCGARSHFASETIQLPKNCAQVQLSLLQSKNASRGYCLVTSCPGDQKCCLGTRGAVWGCQCSRVLLQGNPGPGGQRL